MNIKSNKLGFTLVELLIVIGLFSVLGLTIYYGNGNFQTSSQLADATTQTAQMIREAREKAIARVNAKNHGVYFYQNGGGNDSVTYFQGPTYAGRDTEYDRTYEFETGVQLTDTPSGDTILFTRGKGYISGGASDSLTIEHSATGESVVITVSKYGSVTKI